MNEEPTSHGAKAVWITLLIILLLLSTIYFVSIESENQQEKNSTIAKTILDSFKSKTEVYNDPILSSLSKEESDNALLSYEDIISEQ